MAAIGDVRLVLACLLAWVSACLPLGLREAAAAACPCLAFGFACEAHSTSVRRKTCRDRLSSSTSCPDSPHYSARPRPCSLIVVVVIVELLLSSSPSPPSNPQCLRVLFASHTLVSARRHSPTPPSTAPTTHPRRSGLSVPPPLDDRQTGRRTDTQSDRHQVGNSRKSGSSKSATLSDSVTRPLASCNILCNTIPQLAHAILCNTRS